MHHSEGPKVFHAKRIQENTLANGFMNIWHDVFKGIIHSMENFACAKGFMCDFQIFT